MEDLRDSFVERVSFFGAGLIVVTELLSAFHAIDRVTIAIAWILAIIAHFAFESRRGHFLPSVEQIRIDIAMLVERIGGVVQIIVIAIVLFITLLLALIAPPNHIDPTSYHIPRIFEWMQNHSLAPFPTHVERQIWIGPGAEYFLLHLRLLTGSDRVLNLAQWGGFAGCVVVATLIARELGGGIRAQRFAALVAATTPMAIVQASGGHVDVFASFWLCTALALLLRVRRKGIAAMSVADAIALGCAVGIALMSKAINAIFLAPFIVWCVISLFRQSTPHAASSFARRLALTIAAAAIVNAGFLYRNYSIWHNPLGDPGRHHLPNETHTPAAIASNVIKNASLHLNFYRDNAWNHALNGAIIVIHRGLGISESDRRTTYNAYRFFVPPKSEDEGSSGNPIQFLLILGGLIAAWVISRSDARIFLTCIAIAAVLFAAYLKWQPWGSRFHLPLFMAAAGAVGVVVEQLNRRWLTRGLSIVLALAALPALLLHASRQVVGRHNIFRVPYEMRYFKYDFEYAGYQMAVDSAAAHNCRKIGILGPEPAFEFPLWHLFEKRFGSDFRIQHVLVQNPTARFGMGFQPCEIVGLPTFPPGFVPPAPSGFRMAEQRGSVTVFLPQ